MASWEAMIRRGAAKGHPGPLAKEIQTGAEKATAPQTRRSTMGASLEGNTQEAFLQVVSGGCIKSHSPNNLRES